MDVRQLEYVVAVAEEGSFTRAAQRCHVAQSALSHQVARLEAELGTRLFERTSRSVHISEAGQTLLPYATHVLREMADARTALDGLAGVIRGRLRIGMTQTASRTLDLIPLVGEVHRRYPEVALTTATGPGDELIRSVRDGHLDIAFGALTLEEAPPEVTFSTLLESEPLVAVIPANHPLAKRRRVRLSELSGNGFVEFRSGTTLRKLVDRAFAEAGVERVASFEVGQITDMVQYVSSGLGITIVPRAFADPAPAISSMNVCVLGLADPALQLSIGAYTRTGHSSPITSALLELIVRGVRADTA